jgi:predicted nuclease of predicted toxin-antitoxin system
MSFAVKLDENLARAHVALLRSAGYDADRVYDEGLSGAEDRVVWERVCAEGRFFITLDLDFSDVRRYPPGTHPGILLIRAKNRSAAAVTAVLVRVIAEQPLHAARLPCGGRRLTDENPPPFASALDRSLTSEHSSRDEAKRNRGGERATESMDGRAGVGWAPFAEPNTFGRDEPPVGMHGIGRPLGYEPERPCQR